MSGSDPTDPVVISGAGVVSAAGVGMEETWERLERDPPRPVMWDAPPERAGVRFPIYRAPAYDFETLGLDPTRTAWLTESELGQATDLRHLIAATALALADAKLDVDCEGEDPATAVVVANESPGFEQLSQTLFALSSEAEPREPIAAYEHLAEDFFRLNTFLPPHHLARVFGFRGLALFVNSACTSGLNALEVAVQEVRTGRAGAAVVAAAENPLSLAKHLWFRKLGLYSSDGIIRPFDRRQEGLVFGEAGAAMVVERWSRAQERGARPYGIYLGAGFAQDGWKVTVPSPTRRRAGAAIELALEQAGRVAEEIDLVVPHGVGTAASDQYEAMILGELFGDGHWPLVTAFKPYVGHSLGGSALVETALMLAALQRQRVPPTPGHAQPYERLPVPLATEWVDAPIDLALKLSCGFAGFYGATLFARAKGP